MVQDSFNKFFWGFLFIMFDFRIQGFDIMPDIIGYILFTLGLLALSEYNHHFAQGKTYSMIMAVLSIFSIYERPAQGGGVHINFMGTIVALVSIVLLLMIVYHLLMGIKEMAARQQQPGIVEEAEKKWTYFLIYQIASLFLFVLIFIPPLFIMGAIAMFIVTIILMATLMLFMRSCGQQLQS
ncbi:hypothetical protein D3P09_12980 [Paenibacillus pinisoli]|uniref:Integral membrane protein n=1 Tax=Paenibacillus pinisoli TaxID=1276110 RepID=A0A3A6Q2S7_9BACL|nr:hypothetical protein [Paenibacillus pinisoli]RJX40264.1 hypothetical protein D3P09_12980 [Paenibacillus pinisoli]